MRRAAVGFCFKLFGWRPFDGLLRQRRKASYSATFAAFIILPLASFSVAHAQPLQSLSVITEANAGNQNTGGSISTQTLELSGGDLSNTFNFTGLDGSGVTSTMSYIVNAQAISSYGSLGAGFSSTVSNTIYNANNVKWITNSSGVPDFFNGQADASFTDTLTVQGGSGLASIKLLLHLHGTLSAIPSGGFGYIALWYQLPSGGDTIFLQIAANTQSSRPIDETVATPAFTVNAQGKATVYVLLQAYGEWDLYEKEIPDHLTVSESVDFFDTLGVMEVQGFNASSQPVALTSVIGSSGTQYTVTPPFLNIQLSGQSVILSWSNSAFSLQSAPAISGVYTNVPNATSPYTNVIAGSQMFFRLD
jgi:hypothetical protein